MTPDKRRFKKLRISLTNQCNMACSYCVPEKYVHTSNVPEIISLHEGDNNKKALLTEDLIKVIQSLHSELNLQQVRITGGEPLLHPGLCQFVEEIRKLGIINIGLTSNGFLLALKANELKKAGLKSVNISIDSIKPDTFRQITKKNYLNRVLAGIDRAIDAGLEVKLNAVIMRGINHTQIIDLLQFAMRKKIILRFIELMKMGHLYLSNNKLLYSANEILTDIRSSYKITGLGRPPSSTTRYWQTEEGKQFGIIANETFPFCNDCDRLRLDEYGRIYGCISSNKGIDLLPHLNDPKMLQKQLQKALLTKQPVRFKGSFRPMIQVGG